jgi:membrane-associated phospholipid phosphatase
VGLRKRASSTLLFIALACQARGQNSAPPEDFCSHRSPTAERTVSWRKLGPNVLCDQRAIWIFPLRVAKGRDLVPTLGVAGTSAGFVLLDPSYTPYFRKTDSFHNFNQVFSGRNTGLIIALVPAALYGFSLLRHDRYGQNTFLLSAEAVIGSEILDTVVKDISRRLRPVDIPPNGNFSDTWFKSQGGYLRGSGSLPSGHEIAAISVATILSHRYRSHRWVPWVAYGAAGLIGFSRVTLSSHFVSDVVTGAMLGYSVSRFAVLQE